MEENSNEYMDLAGIPEENGLLGRRRHTSEFIFMKQNTGRRMGQQTQWQSMQTR